MVTAISSYVIGDIAEVRSGFPFRGSLDALPEGNVAVAQMRDVAEGTDIDWAALLHIELPTNRKPEYLSAHDILFTTRGARNTALFLRDVPVTAVSAANLFVIRVKAAAAILPEFLAWQINQRLGQDYLVANATGSHIKNITRPALEAMPIFIPPINAQQAIVKVSRTIFEERRLYEKLVHNRQQQMDALASNLLSGKVVRP